jgi:general secretion pathway protein N
MTDSPSASFLRPAKVILLLLAGILVYLIVLVATMPAGWLWQQISPRIDLPPGLSVERVTGNLWQGGALLTLEDRRLDTRWRIQSPSFNGGTVPVTFSVASGASSVDGQLQLAWSGETTVNADGRIRVKDFEKEIRRAGGAVLAGDVIINRLELAFTPKTLISAEGLAYWSGGAVTWPMGGSIGRADFPPMEARLDGGDQGLSLKITQSGQTAPVARTEILPNGMMDLQVYKRLVDLAGQPWSEAAKPGDVVFRVRQRLFPGADG